MFAFVRKQRPLEVTNANRRKNTADFFHFQQLDAKCLNQTKP